MECSEGLARAIEQTIALALPLTATQPYWNIARQSLTLKIAGSSRVLGSFEAQIRFGYDVKPVFEIIDHQLLPEIWKVDEEKWARQDSKLRPSAFRLRSSSDTILG